MGLLPTPERFRKIISGEARDGFARAWRTLFWWLRFPCALGVWLRNKLYDWGWKKAVRVPGVVISVGNISLGGTGKTPCVEFLARLLRTEGRQVVILSRGYGVTQGPNDEALMLEENLPDVPHLQNRDRVEAALTAVTELEAEELILDDGFQHRRLHRDLDIVLIDASTNWEQEYLFPRGTLREPLSNLNRADLIILTRCDNPETGEENKNRLALYTRNTAILFATHQPTVLVNASGEVFPLSDCRNHAVALLCGIGHPAAFAKTVREIAGKPACSEQVFADHHNYTREDVEKLRAWANTLPPDALVLTTQKDLVKLRLTELAGRRILAVRIEFQLLKEEHFMQLQELLTKVLTPREAD
jgi:tetraacyldisaccharide 4'-kinase